ncbi:MAG: hypothetical protein D6741_04925, partial [Planctomycetota bacterium]
FQSAWAKGGHYLVAAVLAVGGVVLGAWYMLYLVRRVFFGALVEPKHEGDHEAVEPVRDLRFREWCALTPLVVFIVWIGIYPQFFLSRMQPTLEQIYASACVNEPAYQPPSIGAKTGDGKEVERPTTGDRREFAHETSAGTYLAREDDAATATATIDR